MAAPVAIDQRRRLLDAILRVVAERGYAAATVTDVVRDARVSRGTFYELFASKDACFLEAYRRGIDVLHEDIDRALAGAGRGRRAQLEAGLGAYLASLQREPAFARTFIDEVHAAGPDAQRARDDALRGFARRYGRTAGRRAISDATLFVLAAGIEQLVGAYAREHGFDDLPAFLPTLTDTALAVLGGP